MAPRKPFLLRVDPALMDALQRWAADDLRSVNGQIEYLLRQALAERGRLPRAADGDEAGAAGSGSGAAVDGGDGDREGRDRGKPAFPGDDPTE